MLRDSHYTTVYGIHWESEGDVSLQQFITNEVCPYGMHNDNSKMQTSQAWKKMLNIYGIIASTTEPHHPNQNPVEGQIGTVKSQAELILNLSGAPSSLWFTVPAMLQIYSIILLTSYFFGEHQFRRLLVTRQIYRSSFVSNSMNQSCTTTHPVVFQTEKNIWVFGLVWQRVVVMLSLTTCIIP